MAYIALSRGKRARVDDSDYESLNRYKWYVDESGYAARQVPRLSGSHKTIYMHVFIMRPGPGADVDHINGKTLDNRRVNLRVVKRGVNLQNRVLKRDNQYIGVWFNPKTSKYHAMISANKKVHHLGYYKTAADAAAAYDRAARRLYGGKAKVNG